MKQRHTIDLVRSRIRKFHYDIAEYHYVKYPDRRLWNLGRATGWLLL